MPFVQAVHFQMPTIAGILKLTGLYPAIWEKAPGQNWGKNIDLTSKLGKIMTNKALTYDQNKFDSHAS